MSTESIPLYKKLGGRLGMVEVRDWHDFFSRFCLMIFMGGLIGFGLFFVIALAGAYDEMISRQRNEASAEKQELKQLRLDVDALRGVEECQP